MKSNKLLLIGSTLLVPIAAHTQTNKPNSQPNKRPNVIYIMSDDHAIQAIGAYGHPLSKVAPTPNIDKLASEGVLFDRAFCTNSISGPSRAAILTGKHSHKNGFRHNGNSFDGSQQTLSKLLGSGGYRTAVIGKWHLQIHPTGFDYWKVLIDQGEYYNPDFIEMGDTIRATGYTTDIITDYSIDWIEQQRESGEPFFLMLHHKAPHRNWQPAPRHLTLYANTTFPVPPTLHDSYQGRRAAAVQEMTIKDHMFKGYDLKLSDTLGSDQWSREGWGPDFRNMSPDEKASYVASYRESNDKFHETKPEGEVLTEWKFQRYMRDYCATVASVDENIGRLMEYLKKAGLDENTIVIYASDQGFYLGEHGWYDKRFMYEESMRMPLMMRYPAEVKSGQRVTKLVQNIDFAPTILDFCGLPIPNDIQGISFRELTRNPKAAKWRDAIYYRYFENPGIHNVMQHVGVREERYKLICFFSNDPKGAEFFYELYDLERDPTELNNIYGDKKSGKIVKRLKNRLTSLVIQYKDTLPEAVDEDLKKCSLRLRKSKVWQKKIDKYLNLM